MSHPDPVPRAWLAAAAVILVVSLRPLPRAAVVAILAGLLLADRSARPMLKRTLMLLLPTWALLVLMHGLIYPEGRSTVLLGGVVWSADGLRFAVSIGLTVTGLVLAQLILFTAAPLYELVAAGSEYGIPAVIGDVMLNTTSLVALLPERFARAREAQMSRGLVVSGGPIRRVRTLLPVVVPVALSYLADSIERSTLFELKGMSGSGRRTPLVKIRAGRTARRLAAATFFLSLTVPVVRIALWLAR